MARITINVPKTSPSATLRAKERFVHAAVYRLCAPKLKEDWGNPQYRLRRDRGWDGRVPFYEWDGGQTGLLGVGLIPWVAEQLRSAGHVVKINDKRTPVAFLPPPTTLGGFTLWEHQREAVHGLLGAQAEGLAGPMAIGSICTGGGKTLITAAICASLPRERRGLILVPKSGLAHQTARALIGCLGKKFVGVYGAGCDEPDRRFVVSTTQKIAADLRCDERAAKKWLAEFSLVLHDECHHVSHKAGDTTFPEGIFAAVVGRCPAPARFAISGTPLTKCVSQNWALVSQFGQKSVDVKYADLVDEGILACPSFLMVAVPGEYTAALYENILQERYAKLEAKIGGMDGHDADKARVKLWKIEQSLASIEYGYEARAPFVEIHRELIASSPERDAAVASIVGALVARGLKTLVLTVMTAHGRAQAQAISRVLGEPVEFVSGAMNGKKQDAMFRSFAASGPTAIVANKVADEGTDVPDIRALVLAGGGKSFVSTLQRIGRGVRRKAGDNRLLVVDLVDTGHKYLVRHGRQRLREYDVAGVRSGAFKLLGTVSSRGNVEERIDGWLSKAGEEHS